VTSDQLTIGVITPHVAEGPEVELAAMTAGRVAALMSRTWSPAEASRVATGTAPSDHAELRASTEPAALDRAALAFSGRRLATVAHASTTTGYLLGYREEANLVERLAQRFDVPAVTGCAAAAAALHTQQVVGQVQLVHPPWFDEDFDELGLAYFRTQGFNVVVTRAAGLPQDPARVDLQLVVGAVERLVENETEALFLAGTGFRTAGALEELERRTGRLVVGANQALLWGILTATSTRWDITGHGRLLRAMTTTT
jgi:maleate isomerase